MSQSVSSGLSGWVSAAQRVTRRRHLRGAVGLGAAAALVGCDVSGQTAPPATAAPVTITYMSSLPETHPEGATRLELLANYNRSNELNITVDVSEGQARTTPEKMLTLGAAGTPPDLYYSAFNAVAGLFVAGITVDVDAELKGDREWARQRADIFPNYVDSQMWSGKLVAVPSYTNNQGIIYNIGLLQQDGVAPPKQNWTWNDFRTIAERFIRPNIIPFSMAWDDWDHWLGTTGSRPVSKDARKVTIDTPEMLATMELMLGFYSRGICQMAPDGESVSETYRQAKNDTVFELQGAYRFPTYRKNNAPPWMAIHIPIAPVRGQLFGFAGGHSLTISKVAPEKRRAAAQAAKWLTAPRQQVHHCLTANAIPISKAALNDKELQDYLKTDPPYKALVDLAPYGWRWPALPSFAKINGPIDTHVGAILRREVSISAGLDNAQREAQQALDEDVKLMQ
ncbi:MAG: extracellular solute-binding protein [Chloroflexota bacterium]